MDRPKGIKNRYWSKEGKLRIINRVLVDGFSCNLQVIKEKEFKIVLAVSMEFNVKSLCEFIKLYRSSQFKNI